MEGYSKFALFKVFAPKVPGLMSASMLHALGISDTSAKWDLKSTLIVAIIRSFLLNPKPSPISKVQKLSTRDPGIKGPLWVSKQTLPASFQDAADVLQALMKAIDTVTDLPTEKIFNVPEICPVEMEWTGSRPGVDKNEPRLSLDEKSQYERLMSDVTSDVTVLYLHGGALYLMDPASHRVTVARIAKHTGGKCASVRYRLAPQHPFPAALLDCFIAYLSLLSPPKDSVHSAVPANKIVFAGDSAGGNLCLALLQLILELHRSNDGLMPSVEFHGKRVQIPVPAGLALQSPWVDLTRALPSIYLNSTWDYLPPPRSGSEETYESDAIWPAKPPRADLYCEGSMMLHPLVSPIVAKNWSGSPPVFICIGQEMLADEDMIIARRLASSGTRVEFVQFEAMPHVFPAVFLDLPGANLGMEKWTSAISKMVAGTFAETSGVWVEAKTLAERKLDVNTLASHLADEDVDRKLSDARAKKKPTMSKNARLSAKL